MFRSIFSPKSAKAWTAMFSTMAAWYVTSHTGLPPEAIAPVVGGVLTWLVPNA